MLCKDIILCLLVTLGMLGRLVNCHISILLPQTKEEVHVFARVCLFVCLSVSKITQ